ncbi:MAG: M48 family metallopeptidase [Desulfobacterales bacterium]|nr:M48 family metallopeptidase [Desulfobacterales bacterium]
MNIIGIIILITLICEVLLNFIADFLNISVLKKEIPSEFQGLYDAETYKRSQEYLKVNVQFTWVERLFDLTLLLVFWFSKGFFYLDNWVRAFNFGSILSGLIYISVLAFAKFILSLPFSLYSTFVIEEKFGFNKTTLKTYIQDTLKGLVLAAIIGAPILSGIIFFFDYTGQYGWIFCWIFVTIVSLFVHFIAPTWILPLFNKFKPIEEGDLKSEIIAYAEKIDFPLKNIFIVDGSKRSSKSNAFFTGFGNNKRIALFDTLIEKHSTKELIAVLAHEMGHFKKKHILKSVILNILHGGLIFFLLSIFISYNKLFECFFMEHISVYAGLIFFSMLFTPIELLLDILLNIYSRKIEYEADKFAVETTDDKESLVNALKNLSFDNLTNLKPHQFYVFLHYSHPPVLERIKALS